MSTSQAGTGGTTGNIDSPIKLAAFLDNFTAGIYDLDIFRPIFIGPTAAGMRVLARERLAGARRRFQPVSLLVTDWVSSSDPVTLANATFKTIAGGSALTSDSLLEVRLVGLGAGGSVLASIPISGSVTILGQPINTKLTGQVVLPIGGRLTTNGAGTAQQLSTFSPAPIACNTFTIHNRDAANSVFLGDSSVANGTEYELVKGDTKQFGTAISAGNLYIADSGAATICDWLCS